VTWIARGKRNKKNCNLATKIEKKDLNEQRALTPQKEKELGGRGGNIVGETVDLARSQEGIKRKTPEKNILVLRGKKTSRKSREPSPAT